MREKMKNHYANQFPTRFCRLQDVSIAYQDLGDPKGEPVLLIAGSGGQMLSWQDNFIDLLIHKGHRVIRYDNRDIGLSTKYPTASKLSQLIKLIRYKLSLTVSLPYTLDDMADDALGLMNYLGIEKSHIIGVAYEIRNAPRISDH